MSTSNETLALSNRQTDVASGHTGKPIMGVWSMKCKRNPVREVIKYKVCFCMHGGQTKEGVHYTNTFSPVVTWMTICFLLILSLVHNWHTHQIDFVLAYPNAKVSHALYMLVPDKLKVQNGKLQIDKSAPPPWQQKCKMKLLQNLYGLKDAGATWFNHLKKGLLHHGFKQSQVDPCLFYKKDLILITVEDPYKGQKDRLPALWHTPRWLQPQPHTHSLATAMTPTPSLVVHMY